MVRSYESIQIFKLLLVAIIGIVKVYSCTYEYSGVGFLTYGKNVMKILQCKTVQFVNILTVQVFLLTENRVESVKKYATYLNLQSNSAISNYSLLELIFWCLGRITVTISNFPENVVHRNQSMDIFSCVFERVCIIECYFN